MDNNNTSLIEELVELKVQERINQALVDTILDNTRIGRYSGELEISDRGVRELSVILKNFYSYEFNERMKVLTSGEEVDDE